MYNAVSGALRLGSSTPAGQGGDGDSLAPVISSDGASTVLFVSGAGDLLPAITSSGSSLYVYNNAVPIEVQQFAFSSPALLRSAKPDDATITIERLF